MKNERLFDALGSVSPDFVTEAAAAEIPAATPRRRRFRKGMFALVAAMIALITLTVGLTISAEEEPALEEVPRPPAPSLCWEAFTSPTCSRREPTP